MNNKELISIVIPTFNSEKNIFKLVDETIKTIHEFNLEFIIVNDCSPDNTHEECLKILKNINTRITYIKLRKNVGEHNAVMAGINNANGDWVLIMDDDFQNPPNEVLKLINFATNHSFDVVYSKYKDKKHNFFRNIISKINDYSANLILKKPKNLYLSSFKIINKKIIPDIIAYKGPYPYLDGLILSITSKIGSLELEHEKRKIGKSSYSIFKLLKLYSNLVINFSTVPIHFFSIAGLIISLLSGIYGIITILQKIWNPDYPIGYTSIFIAIIFFSGIQLLFLGLIGEYVGKILKNVNNESQYSIEIIKSNK
jgi:glycosyltransferase involved in cell wall biosynthesis